LRFRDILGSVVTFAGFVSGDVVLRARHRGRPEPLPSRRNRDAAVQSAKNVNVRSSMLRRGDACGGEVGSSNEVWAVNRAVPSTRES
jgi:hypothetical protein